jgi:amino acid transporter
MVSWQSMVVIECYVISDIIQAMILVVDSSYVATRWRGTLLTMAAAFLVSTFNIVLARHLSWCEGVFATIHFFAFVPVLFGLVIMAPKPSAAEVFQHSTQTGGNWPDTSHALFVGQVSNLFVMLGSDGVAHLAEEIEDAGVVLPQSMLWSYYVNVPLTLLMVLVYCFSITSVDR